MAGKITRKITIEACVASVASAVAAEQGGADRLELNCALELDGLTPSLGLFQEVRAVCTLPIIVMIRPHGYGFVYSAAEFAAMRRDIDVFLDAGAEGFAIGFLEQDFLVDQKRTRAVAQQMQDRACVFHRAFDVTPSATEALKALIDCGVARVLTSGHATTAPAGALCLKALIQQAQEKIEILPGAGIKPENVAQLIEESGCSQVHGTFRTPQPAISYRGIEHLKAFPPPGTDASVVAAVRAAVSVAGR